MQQFITDGYTRSRMRDTNRSVARAADQWTPRARGPAFRERIGLTLVSVGVSMLGDRAVLERLTAEAPPRAA